MLIDHVVWATPDLDAAAARVTTEWGLTLVAGGSHPGFGTRNLLAGLGHGSYLEVIGPDSAQPPPPRPRPFGIDDLTTDRLLTWCARPARALPLVVADLRALGYDPGEISAMSRRRPDGTLLAWELTQAQVVAPWSGCAPFLIDWQSSRHPSLDLPETRALTELVLTHPDPDGLRRLLGAIGSDDRIRLVAGAPGLTMSLA